MENFWTGFEKQAAAPEILKTITGSQFSKKIADLTAQRAAARAASKTIQPTTGLLNKGVQQVASGKLSNAGQSALSAIKAPTVTPRALPIVNPSIVH